MKKITAIQDLKNTCYHEMGHLMVAFHLGYIGDIEIIKNDNYSPNKYGGDKRFLGVYSLRGKYKCENDAKMIGIAGSVAQFFAENEVCIHDLNEIMDYSDLEEYLHDISYSDTDIESMGGMYYKEWEERDTVIKVVEILKSMWHEFIPLVNYEMFEIEEHQFISLQWKDEIVDKIIKRVEEDRVDKYKIDSEINQYQFTVHGVTLDDIAIPDQFVMHYTTTSFDDQIVKVTYSVSHPDTYADPDFDLDALFSNQIKEESSTMNNINDLMKLFVNLLQQTIITELGRKFYIKTYHQMQYIYQLEWTEEKKINDNLLDLHTVATPKVKHIADLIMEYRKEFIKQKNNS